MSNDIKKLLRIIEPNLITSDISYEMVKGQQTCVVNATFSPPLTPCHHCGSTVYNESGKQVVVRNGKKKSVVRFDQFNHLPLIMNVAKQRYTCKNCAHHWTATPYFVEKGHSISRHVILKIIDLLKEKISFTLIAKLCHVSITTVIRVLRSIKSYLPNPYQTHLPEVLMVDEFRSHCSSEDTMSFICADGITGKLINILPSRKLTQLTAHFKKYPNPNDVKLLVTDMNAAYFQLTKSVFTSAKIIIDRFHVVKHCNKAFQDFRIKEMKRLKQQNNQIGYLKLKANWRRLTKDRMSINHSEYKTWRSFRAPHYPYQTEAMMIDRLLSYSEPLKEAYHCFHDIMDAFRSKNHVSFIQQLKELPETLDSEFRKKLQNLLNYEEGIRNSLIYPYSNGKIEAKNTHIKTLKRVSYGFKSFENMKLRIFMMNRLIEVK
ncbi:ISL3 family transposase [Vagococcus lutrae]|uniref:ISL3 family transposase n=1 Tax=Vagococcus lutrae TaxID=81947 RepID=A0AAE9XK09_9ENTE|nr:ISL3 family transposase [Vagococcus lutrae]WCG22045.1 ISL3 family transposase [Vagococcus lutrae]